MKCILLSGLVVSVATFSVMAKTPETSVEVFRPFTSTTVERPLTKVDMMRPTTQTEVFHPQTSVQVFHPATQVQTTHSVTNVEVFHPQTTVEIFHPQTPEDVRGQSSAFRTKPITGWQNAGKQVSSSQATTSMSDFKPMQAKDFSPKPPVEKAFQMGGGTVELGNVTNTAEKDNANKSSLLGEQKNSRDLEIDPTQKKLGGLEKLFTDREKVKEKKQ